MSWRNILRCVLRNFTSSEYRRHETEKEALIIEKEKENVIIYNGQEFPIRWRAVKTFRNHDGLELPKSCYRTSNTKRIPTMFVAHWDVCLSSKSCFKILKSRNLSVHFLIDNDGTIYQIMDINDVGWHSGSRKINNASIGVEISNAYYLKYQQTYLNKGFGVRPVWKNSRVHGKTLEPHLGFYDVQLNAFRALANALNEVCDIPLVSPMKNNEPVETIYKEAKDATFWGVVNHYHLTTRKIDCAGLKLNEVLK